MTMPINLVLVRHGESEGNVANFRSKHGDDSAFTDEFLSRHSSRWRLTDLGQEQARAAGAWLRANAAPFDRFYVSPYLRALETAKLLDLPSARWFTEPLLRERDWGQLDVMSKSERRQRFSAVMAARGKDPFLWSPPSGESIAQVDQRLLPMLGTWHRECSAMNVVVVGHGEWFWAFRSRIERMSGERWRELDLSNDPRDEIHNCQVLHYTRRDPATGELAPYVGWMRSVCPWDLSRSSNEFTPIVRYAPSNEDLGALLDRYPRLVDA